MAVLTNGCMFVLAVMASTAAGGRVRRWPAAAMAGASAGAGSFASAGGVGVGAGFPPGFFPMAGFVPGFYFPQPMQQQQPFFPDYNTLYQQWLQQMQQAQHAAAANSPSSNNINPDYASSSVTFGSEGGFGEASLGPDNGLGVRIAAEDFGPPSGNSFGTFSSTSIQSSVGPDGKPVVHKESVIGVNDNGKIHFKKVSNAPKDS